MSDEKDDMTLTDYIDNLIERVEALEQEVFDPDNNSRIDEALAFCHQIDHKFGKTSKGCNNEFNSIQKEIAELKTRIRGVDLNAMRRRCDIIEVLRDHLESHSIRAVIKKSDNNIIQEMEEINKKINEQIKKLNGEKSVSHVKERVTGDVSAEDSSLATDSKPAEPNYKELYESTRKELEEVEKARAFTVSIPDSWKIKEEKEPTDDPTGHLTGSEREHPIWKTCEKELISEFLNDIELFYFNFTGDIMKHDKWKFMRLRQKWEARLKHE